MALTVLSMEEETQVTMVRQPMKRVAFVKEEMHLQLRAPRLSIPLNHLVRMFLDGQISTEMVAHGMMMDLRVTVIIMEKWKVPMVRQATKLAVSAVVAIMHKG